MSEADYSPDNKLNPSTNTVPRPGGVKKGYLIGFILVVGIGSLQFGFGIGSFTSLQADFTHIYQWTEESTANFYCTLITSCCTLGSAIGSILIGFFISLGKKNCILLVNILIFAGSGIALIQEIWACCLGRFIYGLATGAFSVLVPKFISELSPTELRGPLGSMTQILITTGIMVAYFFGLAIPNVPETQAGSFVVEQYWRVLFSVPIVLGGIQVLLMLTIFNYDTPKHLKQTNQVAKLHELMGKLYFSDRINERIADITIEKGNVQAPSYSQSLCDPRYQVSTYIGCLLMVLQQFSGINAVMFYAATIFTKVDIPANQATAIVGVVNMVSTCVSFPLLGRFGRKQLLTVMSFIMSVNLIVLGIFFFYIDHGQAFKYLVATFICTFVMLFEFSLGPIPWLYMAEIMTDKGLSLGVLVNWILTLVFAIVTRYLFASTTGGGITFIVFGGFALVAALFSKFVLKETQGLSQEEVAVLYSRENKKTYQNLE